MTQTEKIIKQTGETVLHTYNRFPVVFDHGQGMRLVDVEGKEYLDFGSGIGVFALGYSNEAYKDALKGQVDKIIHTSNLFYHEPLAEAAEKIAAHTGMSKVFFTNSGAEAIEGAIKAARKYAYLRDGHDDHEIIAMNHSFHGRTVGALSVTGNARYQDPFRPLMGGVRFAAFNDLESVKAQLTDKTCAILLETVQGEGGVRPAEAAFLRGVREICDQRDLLLILDEIQCGMGRTGYWFACDAYGVRPDIMTCAKALGCGIPVGAFLLGEKAAMRSLEPGDHGTTYGGNPLACAAVAKVLDLFDQMDLVSHVKETGPYLEGTLDRIRGRFDFLTDRRGMGFMQGLELAPDHPVGSVVKAALDRGLVLLTAGGNVLRFLPPLIAEKEDIDQMADLLTQVLAQV